MNGSTLKNSRSQSDVPREEGEEIKSPKRKNRVESEEAQDYVREEKGHGSGGRRRNEFRTERDRCSAEAFVSL